MNRSKREWPGWRGSPRSFTTCRPTLRTGGKNLEPIKVAANGPSPNYLSECHRRRAVAGGFQAGIEDSLGLQGDVRPVRIESARENQAGQRLKQIHFLRTRGV